MVVGAGLEGEVQWYKPKVRMITSRLERDSRLCDMVQPRCRTCGEPIPAPNGAQSEVMT
ncbi:MAG: hypothetical protein ACTS41_01195 [Candidatus Hodgkinia cicadicola]